MKHKRGFTLIEVMVVVAIIALLAAILMPALRESRRVSKRTACLGHLEQVRIAMQAYLQSNRDFFPNVSTDPLHETANAGNAVPPRQPWPSLPIALKREMAGNSKAFECPSDQITKSDILALPEVASRGWRTYFDMYGTSYEFMFEACGKKLHPRLMEVLQGLFQLPIKDIPLVYDIEIFHGDRDRTHSGTKAAKQPKTFNAMFANFDVRSDIDRRP